MDEKIDELSTAIFSLHLIAEELLPILGELETKTPLESQRGGEPDIEGLTTYEFYSSTTLTQVSKGLYELHRKLGQTLPRVAIMERVQDLAKAESKLQKALQVPTIVAPPEDKK